MILRDKIGCWLGVFSVALGFLSCSLAGDFFGVLGAASGGFILGGLFGTHRSDERVERKP